MNTATAFEQMANAIPYIDKLVNSKEMKAFVEEKSKGDVVGRSLPVRGAWVEMAAVKVL